MNPTLQAVATLLSGACLAVTAGCRREQVPPKRELTPAERRDIERRFEKEVARQATRRARKDFDNPSAPTAIVEQAASVAAPESSTAPSTPARRAGNATFVEDEPVTLGPPAPATATELGVLVNDKEGGLYILRLGKVLGAAPGRTPIHAFPEGTGPYGIGPGPSSFQGAAYWISHGSLVRRKLGSRGDPGPLEILANDAHDGTRVAVPIETRGAKFQKIPDTVAYILRPPKEDAPLLAKLWVDGAAPEILTAEGNSTHSVTLVRTENGVLAVSVQARMAMTPVHARSVRFASGKPLLSEDRVVWVGGGIQSLTEMALLRDGAQSLWGFLPHERSIQEFGLARLDIGMSPDMETPTTWILYPNGIDPAPVAAGQVCGIPMVLHAAPETERPGSRHELLLRDGRDGAAEPYHLASEHVIYFVSVSEIPGGALVVWVTDGASRAVTLRCRRKTG